MPAYRALPERTADRLVGDEPAGAAGLTAATPGNDTINGGEGSDTLVATDGVNANDSLDGGPAFDSCTRDTGDPMVNCP
ncbi:hypothetical protein ACFV0H_17455 [Streptomyces erythrochromogenes]|uniref:hypothetical protein n=1 Tax=Streptomyces erythrochromogenes TaxID=285574 RepID=UPI0036A114F9